MEFIFGVSQSLNNDGKIFSFDDGWGVDVTYFFQSNKNIRAGPNESDKLGDYGSMMHPSDVLEIKLSGSDRVGDSKFGSLALFEDCPSFFHSNRANLLHLNRHTS